MNRRTLLVAAAAATTTGVAGCLRSGGLGDSDPTGTEELNAGDTDDDETRLVDRSFEVERVECGDDYGDHDVTTENGTVTVEGTVDGNDSCYTAELVRGEYDSGEDTLYVEVESVDDADGDEGCGMCIVEIDYVATFEFENGEPGRVRVDQRGQSSGSASSSSSVSESESGGGSETPTATEASGTPTASEASETATANEASETATANEASGTPTATEFPGTPTPTPD